MYHKYLLNSYSRRLIGCFFKQNFSQTFCKMYLETWNRINRHSFVAYFIPWYSILNSPQIILLYILLFLSSKIFLVSRKSALTQNVQQFRSPLSSASLCHEKVTRVYCSLLLKYGVLVYMLFKTYGVLVCTLFTPVSRRVLVYCCTMLFTFDGGYS